MLLTKASKTTASANPETQMQSAQQKGDEVMADHQKDVVAEKVLYDSYKPTNYQIMLRDWISNFHEMHINPAEEQLSETQRDLFEVKWADCRQKLGADIEGSMTKSALEAHKIVLKDAGVSQDKQTTTVMDYLEEQNQQAAKEGAGAPRTREEGKRQQRDRFEEYQGIESIEADRQDITILMEIMMYCGKDVNLVEVFKMYRTIYEKGCSKVDLSPH